jgi:transposase
MSEVRGYVGLDWGAEQHVAVVVDVDGRQQVKPLRLKNTRESVAELVRAVGGDTRGIRVAVEARRLVIVDALLAAGFEVFVINPRQVDRFRDRFSSSGAKDDRRDAAVLASALRTDPDSFAPVVSMTLCNDTLAAATRTLEDLQAQCRRQANQLREVIQRVMPLLLALCPGADEEWFWALVLKAWSPTKAANMRRATVEKLLKTHRIRRLSVDDVIAVLRAEHLAPEARALEACQFQMDLLVARLRLLDSQVDEVKRRMALELKELAVEETGDGHPVVDVIRSAPGFGSHTTAVLLAEGGAAIQDDDLNLLRSLAGVAPVTKQSGKMHVVWMRRAVNRHLRNALHQAAEAARRHDPRFTPIYDRLRARGKSHSRALRGVADRLLTVVMAMIRTRSLYEPQKLPAA